MLSSTSTKPGAPSIPLTPTAGLAAGSTPQTAPGPLALNWLLLVEKVTETSVKALGIHGIQLTVYARTHTLHNIPHAEQNSLSTLKLPFNNIKLP